MDEVALVSASIDSRRSRFAVLSDAIWGYAETGFEEHASSAALRVALEAEGFSVESPLAGIDTAFVASFGSGKPVIALLGEFDALPSSSQAAGRWHRMETVPGGNGHGCGHNLLGVGSLAAAIVAKEYLESAGIPGTVRYYGCPGEEFGSGKTFMARSGSFEGVDLALTWHPGDVNCVLQAGTLANLSVYFSFKGKASHAAASPHLGRSALDAVELMNVGANYLREHMIPEARIHYAITDAGGRAPNVVQERAESFYFARAPRVDQARELYSRLVDVAKGAALMTGTELEVSFAQGLSDYLPNRVAGELLQRRMEEAGVPRFGEAERELARRFRESLAVSDIASATAQARFFQGAEIARRLEAGPLAEVVGPLARSDFRLPGSTDVGDVSQIVPTGQVVLACAAFGTAPHTWQFAAQAGSAIGHEGMFAAARVLGLAAIDALRDPSIARRAGVELRERTGGAYSCPIPESVKPGDVRLNARVAG